MLFSPSRHAATTQTLGLKLKKPVLRIVLAPETVFKKDYIRGKLAIGVCLGPGGKDQALCCGRAFSPQVGPNPFKKENADVYILAVTPSWPLHSSILAIAVTSS